MNPARFATCSRKPAISGSVLRHRARRSDRWRPFRVAVQPADHELAEQSPKFRRCATVRRRARTMRVSKIRAQDQPRACPRDTVPARLILPARRLLVVSDTDAPQAFS